jgi:ferredoxin-NADP reductase
MVHKGVSIPITVKDNHEEVVGYRSIVFERPRGFIYESGDWIDLRSKDKELKGGQTYSLSSSPTEPDLKITFKDGLSEMKCALRNCVVGDTFVIFQYGNAYQFTLKPHKKSTLIAGGVGIAPFRSMVKEMADKNDVNDVRIIYLNKTNEFLFKHELDSWSNYVPNLHITYILTENLNKKERDKRIISLLDSKEQFFYIAGPDSMVENTEHLLLDSDVDLKDIKTDIFSGY